MKRQQAAINRFMGEGMADIVIRKAVAADILPLGNMLEQSWFAHWGPHVSAESRARFVREHPARGYAQACWQDIMVAELNGAVVGMYHLDRPYLHSIHVAVDHIGSGIGRAMMTRAEGEGARRLEVRAFNERARHFYERRGWLAMGQKDDTEMGTPVVTIQMALAEA
ncbi:GNAT family N-acetyltransferase [Devosia ginsengisoli]|uniref:GNAT family N-acetyltransferase n=2 Tax=Devosia ginsengisoli TaxID=400770 RepID=A0A5B8LT46_9HYPH|nr:GNAT family N-acetyltransferase [Devosia ginsengisoli]